MIEGQPEANQDRKAADRLIWTSNQLAAGESPRTLAPVLTTLPEPWLSLAQKALSTNGGVEFLATLELELQSHPEGDRLQAAIALAKATAEEADVDLIQSLPRPATATGTTSDARAEQAEQPSPAPTWPSLRAKALYGLPGDFVRLIEPHTEADPVALLVQILVGAGSVIGPGPHFRVESDNHSMNLFAVLVGATSKGRKGSSWSHVRRLLTTVDRNWGETRIASGLSSGEGLIWNVRDPIEKAEPIRERRVITGYQIVLEDPGITDKRLLVLESEFASVLRVVGRDGNTLSPVVRQAWDSGNLQSLTKNSPARATRALISIVGHVTVDELRRYITQTEVGNGFANRILWLCVKRSRILPDGGGSHTVDLGPIVHRLTEAVEFARQVGEMNRDDDARALWHEVYGSLSEGRPGLLGAVTSRAEAQVMRLSCVYALLDRFPVIRREHLEAALALWEYCDTSARFIFGEALGDPIADQIVQALRVSPVGLTRTEISNLFHRNRDANHISRALGKLQELGLASPQKEITDGRSADRWLASGTSAKAVETR